MRDSRPRVLGTALMLGALIACQNAPQERALALRLPNDEAPVVEGIVEAKRPLDSLLVTDRNRLDMCGRYLAKIASTTVIETASGRRMTLAEVRVGDRAAMWTDGPVLESCPGQLTATLLRVAR